MDRIINAKELRASLPAIVKRVRRGERFTVLYRSRPAFRLVPLSQPVQEASPLEQDPVYRAAAVGRSTDGMTSADHDAVVYGQTATKGRGE